jgi:hypothetical protein
MVGRRVSALIVDPRIMIIEDVGDLKAASPELAEIE